MKSETVIEISSDSDDSILELPISLKSSPPVILLLDSDNDFEENGNKCVDNNFIPSHVCDSDSSSFCKSSGPIKSLSSARKKSPGPSNEIEDKSSCHSALPKNDKVADTSPEADKIMLNRRDVQADISSFNNIVQIHENKFFPSKMTNCINLADSDDQNLNKTYRSFWEKLGQENFTVTNRDIENSMITSFAALSNQNVQGFTKTEQVLLKNGNDEQMQEKTTRKRRSNDECDKFTNFNAPEIPEKRAKGKIVRSSRELSLTEYFFTPMSRKLKDFYNKSCGSENFNVCDIQSRMPRNPNCWTILDADLFPSSKKRNLCPRCRTDSHVGKECPLREKKPNCCICGVSGHLETRCPQTMCLTCGHKYATFRPTCERCCNFYCDTCNGMGHARENCPDLWRRYHNTTTELVPVPPKNLQNVMKSPRSLSCCNCAKRGHDETTCNKLRWSQHFPTATRVISYTNGPNYSLPDHEFTRDIDSNECIDIIDISRSDDDTLLAEPNESKVLKKLLFQSFNVMDPVNLNTVTIRLDTLSNAHMDGLLSGRMRPTFLHSWQRNFTFNLRIVRNPDCQIVLTIEANCEKLLVGLKKILMQWLTRRDDEKSLLTYDALPYENLDLMRTELERKILRLNAVKEPIDIMNEIALSEAEVLELSRNSGMNDSSRKQTTTEGKSENELRIDVLERKCDLVTSLYSRSLIQDGDVAVATFRDLVRELKDSRKNLSVEDYLNIVYLYNEIFTFRKSDTMSEAMAKVTSVTQSLTSVPGHGTGLNAEISNGKNLDAPKNHQLVQINDALSDKQSTFHASTLPQYSQISNNRDIVQVVANTSKDKADSYETPSGPSTSFNLSSGAFLGEKTNKLPLTPHLANFTYSNRGNTISKCLKRQSTQCFLSNVSNKRENCQMTRDTVAMARLSNYPRLQNGAQKFHVNTFHDDWRHRLKHRRSLNNRYS